MALWSVAPFVLMLLAIALLPVVAGHFWHSNFSKALVSLALGGIVIGYLLYYDSQLEQAFPAVQAATIVGWGAGGIPHFGILAAPVSMQAGPGHPALHALEHILLEYVDFIILLLALFTVSGGIVLEGNLRASPLVNTAFLAFGAVLANFIGTTGASMLLIRPMLRINERRLRNGHVPVFFIFIVSNIGGLLTPLADPPLFLGFLRGVDFFWTLALVPQWAVTVGITLFVFFLWDTSAYLRDPEIAEEVAVDAPSSGGPLRLHGLGNFVFLAGILAAVLLQSETLATQATGWLNQFFNCPSLHLVRPWGALVMLAMAVLSLLLTSRALRQANDFNWDAILEVAVLFIGIFITMIPALALLKRHGPTLGIEEPWQYFWLTGSLSSFLDNAPTYLTFATVAAGQDNLAPLMTMPGPQGHPGIILQAISCGAVFMGANTYIGNGPNFMVKAIADAAGYRTPSFFGYMLYSAFILLPIFGLITWLFFGG